MIRVLPFSSMRAGQLLLFVFCICHTIGKAQASVTDTGTIKRPPGNSWIYELDYCTNRSFKGTLSGSTMAYTRPSLSFYHKSGFNVYADALYFISGREWDQANLALGYSSNLSDALTWYATYTHSFFRSGSEQVNADLTDNPSVALRARYKPVSLRLTYDYYFGASTDHYLTFDVYRYFYFDDIFTEGDDDFAIKPKFSWVAGTLDYYTGYTKRKTAKGVTVSPVTTTRFRTTSYNLGVNLPYTYKHFTIEPSATLSVPVNQQKGHRTGRFWIVCLYAYLTF